ncbi:MAG: ATP-binding cassette domain-containing protein [Pseudomonadota bacterium]|nr:ATP-binding cassette domain-containing protein [Pseudomonadota bacterium]
MSKRFGDLQVLDGVDLHIPANKITFLIGRSGEGKSVTIKHMIGLMKPDSGEIYVDGKRLSALQSDKELREHRKKFGLLFQHSALFDNMDVLNNVCFPIRELEPDLPDTIVEQRAIDCLSKVEMNKMLDRFPNELSTGEKKRAGLARALASEPKILLYDEPTTGIDPLLCETVDRLIVKINNDSPSVSSVVISHDIKAALAIAEKIIMLHHGKVILAGDAETFRRSDNPVVRQFLSGKISQASAF